MDNKVAMMLEKVKIMAGKTSKAATRAVESAGKAAGDMAQATKINLQIFDLNTDCEVLYKEIGKLVYDIHLGADVAPDAMGGGRGERGRNMRCARYAGGNAAGRMCSARPAARRCTAASRRKKNRRDRIWWKTNDRIMQRALAYA